MAEGANGANGQLATNPNDTQQKHQNTSGRNQDVVSKPQSTPQDTPNGSEQVSREGTPPPLPPRPKAAQTSERPQSPAGPLTAPRSSSQSRNDTKPALQSKPTTALSLTDIQTQSHGGDEQRTSPTSRNFSYGGFKKSFMSRSGSEGDDSASVMSYAPTLEAGMDMESMLGDVLGDASRPPLKPATPRSQEEEQLFVQDEAFEDAFEHEFDELDDITSDGLNEDAVLQQWRSKLKHFLILSSAGKPVWSRHGNDQLITSSVGVIQTIISFYQGVSDSLKGFTAGGARFVVLSKGSLNFVAISRIGESDQQLRVQLEALYMQILSTLTLPVLERMFKTRASTDLRRPLQGTEKLLSALADGFTRGSPSTLLQALECLRLRKSHRTVVNNTLLKVKVNDLLYGLIVAGGRLVSVVRPRKHSLHPGDLHLIFNMLFEAGSVRAGGGENWIPLCLPGFNNTGYVYMYVSFLNLDNPKEEVSERPLSSSGEDEEVAILLISTNRESFYELRQMRDDLVQVQITNIHFLGFPLTLSSNCAKMAVLSSSALLCAVDALRVPI